MVCHAISSTKNPIACPAISKRRHAHHTSTTPPPQRSREGPSSLSNAFARDLLAEAQALDPAHFQPRHDPVLQRRFRERPRFCVLSGLGVGGLGCGVWGLGLGAGGV